MKRYSIVVALLCAACRNDSAPTTSTSVSTAAPPGQTSTAPSVAATATEGGPYCVTAAESQRMAKPHRNAEPPYATCAEGIFSHCGGGDGERGHLCSKPLDPKATESARKTQPDVCCYRMD